MKLIGIMGGTFNPIHEGHIQIAKAAYEQYHLDEVWFMPNHIPGYKDNHELLDGNTRLNMVKLAISDYPYFKTSDYEIKKSGNTYTAETMRDLSNFYPQYRFYFIIGADSLDSFDKWKQPEIIVKYAKVLAAPRDDSSKDSMHQRIEQLHKQFGPNHFFPVECGKIDCSSSDIRKHLIENELPFPNDIREELAQELHLPYQVLKYITEKHLYQK